MFFNSLKVLKSKTDTSYLQWAIKNIISILAHYILSSKWEFLPEANMRDTAGPRKFNIHRGPRQCFKWVQHIMKRGPSENFLSLNMSGVAHRVLGGEKIIIIVWLHHCRMFARRDSFFFFFFIIFFWSNQKKNFSKST